jgi:holliday junction DNA helicase RuvA
VLDVGGIGLKVYSNKNTLKALENLNASVEVYTFLYVREEQMELYGFLTEQEQKFFELLNSVSGIGPKTALGVLESDSVENIMAAILEKRPELLTKASGIGKKTAERIILELESKVHLPASHALTETMNLNLEVEDALVGLGYLRGDVKKAIQEIDVSVNTLEGRLKNTLQRLSKFKK